MRYNQIIAEIYRLVGLVIAAAVIGWLLGQLKIAVMAALLLYLACQLYHLQLLFNWSQHRHLDEIPDAGGLWGQIYDRLSRGKRRDIREKNRLKSVIFRVEATTAALNDAVILLNENNEINWSNKATIRLLNLKPGDVGNNITNFIRNPVFVHYLASEDYQVPLTLPSPSALDQYLEFQITRFGKGEGLLVVRDITRIYKLEQMRKDFVANVGHELRTPLTVIRGYLETLEDAGDPALKTSDLWQKASRQMWQQSQRMTALINDLILLSRLETDTTENNQQTVVLTALFDRICDEARAIGGQKQPIIHCQLDKKLTIIGNERELHSAFSNLVTNAVKYSEPGKPVTLKAGLTAGGDLVVAVEDQGIGIEPQHIGRLTERFYRVDSSRSIASGGTGLGLAIVKHILLRHHARLDIDSAPGKGSSFRCVFPAKRAGFSAEADAS